jgi:hypothetical protein
MQLSDAERAELARDLVRSLDAPSDVDAEGAWDHEIARRLGTIADSTAQFVDRAELRRRIQARLNRI